MRSNRLSSTCFAPAGTHSARHRSYSLATFEQNLTTFDAAQQRNEITIEFKSSLGILGSIRIDHDQIVAGRLCTFTLGAFTGSFTTQRMSRLASPLSAACSRARLIASAEASTCATVATAWTAASVKPPAASKRSSTLAGRCRNSAKAVYFTQPASTAPETGASPSAPPCGWQARDDSSAPSFSSTRPLPQTPEAALQAPSRSVLHAPLWPTLLSFSA